MIGRRKTREAKLREQSNSNMKNGMKDMKKEGKTTHLTNPKNLFSRQVETARHTHTHTTRYRIMYYGW